MPQEITTKLKNSVERAVKVVEAMRKTKKSSSKENENIKDTKTKKGN
ncbi:unnamed protein product [marine sediment metagenome]|uniref:Uncharacterized protein n=1 Tax=marine sediment metagenome TaxID=412755 RepID=X1JDV7_9ZZZZ